MGRKEENTTKKSSRKAAPKSRKDSKSLGRKASGMLNDFRYGKTVSVNFFKTNVWLLLIFIVIVLALMGMRYKTKTKMEEIKKLEKELVVSETEMLREKSAYMTLIRETEMLRLVRQNNLGLVFQEQPPYEITLVNQE